MTVDTAIRRLLIVDASPTDAEALADVLRRGGYSLFSEWAADAATFGDALQRGPWDLILLSSPVLPTEHVVQMTAAACLDAPVVVLAAEDDKTTEVAALEAGAVDYLPHGNTPRFLVAIRRALMQLDQRREAIRYKQRMQEAEQRFLSLLDNCGEAVTYLHEGMHILGGRQYLALLGLPKSEMEHTPFLDLVQGDHHNAVRDWLEEAERGSAAPLLVSLKRTDGAPFEAYLAAMATKFNGETCLQVTVRPTEEGVAPEPLTNVAPKTYEGEQFVDEIEKTVALARATDEPASLALIDLDGFQSIKEAIGIAASETLLQEVAQLIRQQAGEGTLGRLSSNVFAWLRSGQWVDEAIGTAERTRQALEEHIFSAAGRSVTLTCSIGITAITDQTPHSQAVLAEADTACAVARDGGGNRVHVFDRKADKAMGRKVERRWAERVEAALASDELLLVYMPIVSLHAEPGERYEVYARMRDEQGEILAPARFLHAIEETGSAARMDRWVIQHALQRLAVERDRQRHLDFFMKLSATALKDRDMLAWLRTVIDAAEVPPGQLVFQISETAAVESLKEAKNATNALRSLGCRIALEHFGLQKDTFRSLKYLDVDYLKIDGSLIHELATEQRQRDRVRRISEFARNLGKQTIATHVQDAASLALLWQDGVNFIQGYYLQQPGEELRYDFTAQ